MAAVVTITAFPTAAQVMQPGQPVRQVDHVMIRTGEPKELFDFFVNVLQLPVAWPLMSPRAGVTTGGVSFGNVNVEAIEIPGQTDNRPWLVSFAIEPSELRVVPKAKWIDAASLTGLLRPVVARAADGSANTLWTNVTLRQFSDSDGPADATVHIFLCEYSLICT